MTPKPAGVGDVLDGRPDVLDVVARPGGGDTGHHRQAGRVDERPGGRPGLGPDVEGPRARRRASRRRWRRRRSRRACPRGSSARRGCRGRSRRRSRCRCWPGRAAGDRAGIALERGVAPAARMWRSARRSSSAVETPGRSSDSTSARTSATIRPARRIRSISAADLTVIWRARATAIRRSGDERDLGHEGRGHGVDGGPAVDRAEDARARGSRRRRRRAHRAAGPAGPGPSRPGRRRAGTGRLPSMSQTPGDARRMADLVVDVAVGAADPAAGQAADELVGGDLDVDGPVDLRAARRRGPRRGRRPGSRLRGKPSRIGPGRGVAAAEPLEEHARP